MEHRLANNTGHSSVDLNDTGRRTVSDTEDGTANVACRRTVLANDF